MSLATLLMRRKRPSFPAIPAHNQITTATRAILARWPDVVKDTPDRDREALLRRMQSHVVAWDWDGVKLSFINSAARVAFDPAFRERAEFRELRQFFASEIAASDRAGFLNAMMAIYVESYVPGAEHTRALCATLRRAQTRIGARWHQALATVPALLDPERAHVVLGAIMEKMPDPWNDLKRVGFAYPHSPGLLDHAHQAMVAALIPRLDQRDAVDFLLSWLKPPGQSAKTLGAAVAVEAILAPWLKREPGAEMSRHITESLVSVYGDPRLRTDGTWSSVGQDYKQILLRWLTRENILFFLDVVSAVEDSHMWEPRRKFWLDLFKRGYIDNAWVAFSNDASRRARQVRQSDSNRSGLQFGQQTAAGSRLNTSLLVLQIGECVVIEGSHSYKVHVFGKKSIRAPKMFQPRYDCEDIRLLPGSKTVVHNGNWQDQVMQLIETMR